MAEKNHLRKSSSASNEGYGSYRSLRPAPKPPSNWTWVDKEEDDVHIITPSSSQGSWTVLKVASGESGESSEASKSDESAKGFSTLPFNMSSRPPSKSEDYRQSGLMEALDNLGRTKGSSATPMVSPTPTRNIKNAVDSMNMLSFNERMNLNNQDGHKQGDGKPFTQGSFSNQPQPQARQKTVTFQDGPPSQGQIFFQTQGIFQPPSRTRQGTTVALTNTAPLPSPSAFGSFSSSGRASQSSDGFPGANSANLHAKLQSIQRSIQQTTTIPRQLQQKWLEELRSIGDEHESALHELANECSRAKRDRDNFQSKLWKLENKLRDASSNIRDSREEMTRELDELRLKTKESHERLRQLYKDSEQQNKKLERALLNQSQQLRMREDQVSGKRSIWMETSSQRSSQAHDPYNTPSANRRKHVNVVNPTSTPSPNQLHHTPQQSSEGSKKALMAPPQRPVPTEPASMRKFPKLPTGRALPGNRPTFPHRHIPTVTEVGGDAQTALVVHQSPEELARGYIDVLTKIYSLLEGWVSTYSCVPNPANDQAIARSNQPTLMELWEYMLKLSYPLPSQRQDAATHTLALLASAASRKWFIMRIVVTYLTEEILDVSAWKEANDEVARTLDMVKHSLDARGLVTVERQSLLDRQSSCIQDVVASSGYSGFRSDRLARHSKNVRDKVGPLLNMNASRASAGKDLGAIIILAWDLSAKMHTSRMSFQIFFPDTSSKFGAATMYARDARGKNPYQLQIDQVRLKLIITPVITMRDDTGRSIQVKNLHKANVLIMS